MSCQGRRQKKRSPLRQCALVAGGCCLLPFYCVYITCDTLIECVKPPFERIYSKHRARKIVAQEQQAIKRRAKERMENAPKPLPEHRPRSLSLLSIPRPLSPCHFLAKLPLEIREEIYKYVVGGNLVHIVRKGDKLAHVRCAFDRPWDLFRECRRAAARTCYDDVPTLAFTANGNVALLRTCRQIYTEAVNIMYKHNSFDFDHQDLFLFFSRSILPQRLAQIRRLELNLDIINIKKSFPWIEPAPNSWSLMWSVIGKHMPGLRHLSVQLGGEYGRPYPDMDNDWWLQSLLQVRNLKTFHFAYRAPSSNWTEFGDGVFEMSSLLEDHITRIVCSAP